MSLFSSSRAGGGKWWRSMLLCGFLLGTIQVIMIATGQLAFVCGLRSILKGRVVEKRIVDFAKCELCDFDPVGIVNSTSRDAVFTYATGSKVGIELCIRSIRSTGCRARIIVFTPDPSIFTPLFTKCGCEFVTVEAIGQRGKASPWQIRFEWYYIYLRQNYRDFDRILHIDSRDTFFFGDPFSVIKDDRFYVFGRGIKMRNMPLDLEIIERVYGRANEGVLDGMGLNCGGCIGGSREFTKFMGVLVGHTQWSSSWVWVRDQASFNVVFHGRGPLDPTRFQVCGCTSHFPPLNTCYQKKVMEIDEKGNIVPLSGGEPIYIGHQYDRYVRLIKFVGDACHLRLTRRILEQQ